MMLDMLARNLTHIGNTSKSHYKQTEDYISAKILVLGYCSLYPTLPRDADAGLHPRLLPDFPPPLTSYMSHERHAAFAGTFMAALEKVVVIDFPVVIAKPPPPLI